MGRNGEIAPDRWPIFTGPEPIRFTQIGPDPESVPRSVRSLVTTYFIADIAVSSAVLVFKKFICVIAVADYYFHHKLYAYVYTVLRCVFCILATKAEDLRWGRIEALSDEKKKGDLECLLFITTNAVRVYGSVKMCLICWFNFQQAFLAVFNTVYICVHASVCVVGKNMLISCQFFF